MQYRAIYYEAYDNIDRAISKRFDQADFLIYKDLQQVFMNAVQGMPYEEEMRRVCKTYSADFSYGNLAIPVFARLVPESERKKFSIADLYRYFKMLTKGQKSMLPSMVTLAKLLLVMPATNAESERIFSAMTRVKTYMRSTTSDNRLNHLMTLHVHKEELDNIDKVKVANDFVGKNTDRQRIFGTVLNADIPIKRSNTTRGTQTNTQQYQL